MSLVTVACCLEVIPRRNQRIIVPCPRWIEGPRKRGIHILYIYYRVFCCMVVDLYEEGRKIAETRKRAEENLTLRRTFASSVASLLAKISVLDNYAC